MDSYRIHRKLEEHRKQLSISFYQGRTLSSRGYGGDHQSFFSELTYGASDTGISVTSESALNYTAYWSCVRLLSETLASLPLFLYERIDPRGKARAIGHPLFRLLHSEPNPEMDSFSFIETLMYHLCSCSGNAYAYIDRAPDRLSIQALWPMNPNKVTKARNEQKEIVYIYQFDDGPRTLPAYRVWHIPGFGFDGLIGYTPISHARNQIGLGLATEKTGAKLFGNGLTVGGILQHPKTMTLPAQERFKKALSEEHEGVDKAHKLLILEEGMTYQKNNIPPEDAQFLETRKFQRNEIASFFRVPPHMIGDLDKATFSNIEQQSLEFAIYTMRPWLVRWERSINRQLLNPQEKDTFYAEFLIDGLLRGDMESRYRAYAIGRNWGWFSVNDVLELENRNPIGDDGDTYMVPTNMVPADQFNAQMIGDGRGRTGT
jgi:HK97 family phage portal protein